MRRLLLFSSAIFRESDRETKARADEAQKRKVEAEKSSNGTSKVKVAEFVCYVRTSTYYVSRE